MAEAGGLDEDGFKTITLSMADDPAVVPYDPAAGDDSEDSSESEDERQPQFAVNLRDLI
jgi:hypothetical protein